MCLLVPKLEQKGQQGIEPEQQRMAEKQDSERFKDRNEECPTDKDSLRINQSQMDCDMEREAKARIRHTCPPVYMSPRYSCPPTHHLFPTSRFGDYCFCQSKRTMLFQ